MSLGDLIIRLCDGAFGSIEAVHRWLGRPEVKTISTHELQSLTRGVSDAAFVANWRRYLDPENLGSEIAPDTSSKNDDKREPRHETCPFQPPRLLPTLQPRCCRAGHAACPARAKPIDIRHQRHRLRPFLPQVDA
ncbi:hypothetical protein [Candidatus Laterigemmans baculatus]|uniref:hypothetical protein n=1 Tax=Candidatus Laterigemmans baculatus TaxID=2770505 RepID=UPI00193C478A|nr:hypothetical protein [Candidatus Laterigemmans baculatus]